MRKNKVILKMTVLAMLVALGVVISPILRVEGMCPMAHFINIVCAVLLGPWYALICAVLIGIIRMLFLGIPPLALTGAVFGAFLSGVLYRASKGRLIFAVAGEVIGTGIIGAVISYPVMTYIVGREGLSLFFYVPSFIMGTLIGGSVAFIFLKQLIKNNILVKYQTALGSAVYTTKESIYSNAFGLAFVGVIVYIAVLAAVKSLFKVTEGWLTYLPYFGLALFIAAAVVYLLVNLIKKKNIN